MYITMTQSIIYRNTKLASTCTNELHESRTITIKIPWTFKK